MLSVKTCITALHKQVGKAMMARGNMRISWHTCGMVQYVVTAWQCSQQCTQVVSGVLFVLVHHTLNHCFTQHTAHSILSTRNCPCQPRHVNAATHLPTLGKVTVLRCHVSILLCNVSILLCHVSILLCNVSILLCNGFFEGHYLLLLGLVTHHISHITHHIPHITITYHVSHMTSDT